VGLMRTLVEKAAKGLVKGAGKAVRRALGGPQRDEGDEGGRTPPPDPFAKLKAQEKQRAEAAEAARSKADR
jgi:hypothetical protein